MGRKTKQQAAVEGELLGDDSLLRLFKDRRARGIKFCRPAWERIERHMKFSLKGEQWPEDTEDDAKNKRAARLSMNEIRIILNTLSGRQIMQRFGRKYIPRSQAQSAWAEMMTVVDQAIMETADAETAESAAFRFGPGVGGLWFLRFQMDDLEDENGRLTVSDIPAWEMIWPADEARACNLADRDWHIHGSWWPVEAARQRFPDMWDAAASWIGRGAWDTHTDTTKSSPIPWMGMAGSRELDVYDRHSRQVWVEFYEYRETVTVYQVKQPKDPAMKYSDALAQQLAGGVPETELFDLVEMTWAEVREWMATYRATHGVTIPKRSYMPRQKRVYRYAYICGDVVLEQGDSPVNAFTIEAITGFRIPLPQQYEWQGLVDGLVDVQKWKNVFLSMLLRMLQVNPKGVLFAERGFFKNRNDGLAQFARPGGFIEVEKGKLSGPAPPYRFEAGGSNPATQMVESLMGYSDSALPRLAGFNAGALGQLGNDLRRISGAVVQSVQDAAMTSNAELFDSLRQYRKRAGALLLAFLEAFYEVEDIVEIVGEERAYEEAKDPATGEPTGEWVLLVPPKETWRRDFWKTISIQETTPNPDAMAALWESLSQQGVLQTLLQQGMFTNEDLAEIVPHLPEHLRKRMILRAKNPPPPPTPPPGDPNANPNAQPAAQAA